MLKFIQIFSVFVIFLTFSTSKVISIQVDESNDLWPYVVSVQKDDNHACDGTAIGNRAILTSFKCIRDVYNADCQCFPNLSIKFIPTKQRKGLKYEIIKVIHNVTDLHDDLAILFVKNPIEELKWNDLEIFSFENYRMGRIVYWRNHENSEFYEIAEKAAHLECTANGFKGRGEFCAITRGIDKCAAGVSGSPLIQLYSENRYQPAVMGILTIESKKCNGRAKAQNIFIDLGYYKEKIESLIMLTILEIEENIKKQSNLYSVVKEETSSMGAPVTMAMEEDENEDESDEE